MRRITLHSLLAAASALAAQSWALAAWAGPEAAPNQPAAPSPLMEMSLTGALVKMVGGLAAVLALMMLLYWLLRRFLPGQGTPLKSARMRLLGRLGLGQRAQVALVRVGERVLVLGVTPNSVTLLDKLEEAETADQTGGAGEKAAGRFAQVLRRASGREEQGS